MHQQFLEAIYAIGDEISGAFKIFEYADDLINESFAEQDFSICNELLKEIDLSKCSDGIALLFASAFAWDKDRLISYADFFSRLKEKIVRDLPDDNELLIGLEP